MFVKEQRGAVWQSHRESFGMSWPKGGFQAIGEFDRFISASRLGVETVSMRRNEGNS